MPSAVMRAEPSSITWAATISWVEITGVSFSGRPKMPARIARIRAMSMVLLVLTTQITAI